MVKEFEYGLDSILMDSVEAPELDASFDEPDVFTSSVSSRFLLCLASTILIT